MKVYAYFVEDHDGEYNNAVSAEEKVAYGYWQVSDVYASLEDARERMRNDYLAYKEKLGDNSDPYRFKWRELTYLGKRVWECMDTWEPYGWKIIEQEVK